MYTWHAIICTLCAYTNTKIQIIKYKYTNRNIQLKIHNNKTQCTYGMSSYANSVHIVSVI